MAFTVAIGVIGYFLQALHRRVEKHLEKAESESSDIAVLKAMVAQTLEQFRRIEEKLDRLIERRQLERGGA